jgi:large subunit ribosomal protein L18
MKQITRDRNLRRKRRIRAHIFGTAGKPRISVFRSNRYIFVQGIDDEGRKTIVEFSSLHLKKTKDYQKGKKTDEAKKVGLELAKRLKGKKIAKAVFDRGIYSYLGRVKSLAEGVREGGIAV